MPVIAVAAALVAAAFHVLFFVLESVTFTQPSVAGRFGLTAGRVSQLRRTFERRWLAFHGEAGASSAAP